MEFLRHIFLTIGWWTYVLVGLELFLEASAFFGVVLPGDTTCILMGILVGGRIFALKESLIIMVAACFLGDTGGYLLGRYKGEAILNKSRWARLHYDRHHDRIVRYSKKWGEWIVVIGRFLPFIRAVTPFTLGMTGLKYRRFLPFALVAAIAWVDAYFWIGYAFGNNWRLLDKWLAPIGGAVIAIIVIAIVAWVSWRYWDRIEMAAQKISHEMQRRWREKWSWLRLP
ncbi:MAG: DedA family protein [Candidatus Binataceae bacterium]